MIIRAIDYMSLTIISKYIKCFFIASILLVSFNLRAQITTFPYSEDFESGPAGWFAQGNTSWELGTPSTPIINNPASGSNAWVTNLNGNYSVNEDGWLESPVFDFSALSIPEIQFAIWWNCEEISDGVVFQSSINSGSSWENVGNFGDFNWFTHQFITANPGGQGEGWSGSDLNGTGSEGWRIAAYGLPNLIGQSNVIFRFAFGSDSTGNDEGIGFDLIKIYDGDCNAGDDQYLIGCYSKTDVVDFNNFLSFDASTTGTWEVIAGDALFIGSEIDMEFVEADNYIFRYTVTNGNCIDSADIFINIEKSLDAGIDASFITCSGFTYSLLFAQLGGSPDPGGTWSQDPLDESVFIYEHPPMGSCPGSSATVTVSTTGSFNFDEDTVEEPCYIFETVNLNDYLPDGIPEIGGTWTFRPPAEEPDRDVTISEGDDVDFPDTGAGEIAYTFDYGVTEDCTIYSYNLTVNVIIDPFPDAGEDKTITFYCYEYLPINLNQLIQPNNISTHISNWESLDGLTIQGTDEVVLPDNGLGQFLYTFNYTLTNSCGQEDTSVIEIYLDLADQAISIPDSEFERYLIDDGIDSNPVPNGEIALSDICGVTLLNIYTQYDISSFEGLQYFTDLDHFFLSDNNATFIDVIDFSGNPLLREIDISNSPNLNGIDITENIALEDLRINSSTNPLITVDISNNYNLEYINLSSTGITNLDVSNNILLKHLFIGSNPLSQIEISPLTSLSIIQISYTQIEFLDVSNNTQLNSVFADNAALISVNAQSEFNENLGLLRLINNPNLSCILVDDITNAEAKPNWTKDPTATYIDDDTLISVGIDSVIPKCETTTINESDLLTSLGADAGGFWTPSINSVNVQSGTYTYAHDECGFGYTSEITVLPLEIQNHAGDAVNSEKLICPGDELSESELRSSLTFFELAFPGGIWKDGNGVLVTFPVTDEGFYTYTHRATNCYPETSNSVTVTEVSCSTQLNLKIFLEGAYETNTGFMRDDMRNSGILPTVSPYSDAINCDVSVFNTTGSNAVIDWVWLELRDLNNQTTVIESRSALLRADGTVVDVDGISPLAIDVPMNDYYLMISHRNHLGVLTLDSYTFDGTALNIDLTTSNLTVQGGNNAISSFSDGTYGLYAGDFNGDGQIQNTDRNGVTPLRGISGYNNADINLNGEVQNSDINGILTPNIGKGEQFMSRNLFAPRRQN